MHVAHFCSPECCLYQIEQSQSAFKELLFKVKIVYVSIFLWRHI